MKRPSRKIMGIGLFALDMIVSPAGELLSSGLGGSAGNVLAIMASLGWTSAPIANLGRDVAGLRLINEFVKLNADMRHFRQSETSLTPIIYQHQLDNSPEKTHCFSFSCPICGEKRSPKASFLSTKAADSVFLEMGKIDALYLDRATSFGVELAEKYYGSGTLIIFEPSTIGDDPELFCRALRCAHIVKYADDRLQDLANFPTNKVAVEICTMGRAGLRYRAPSLGEDWVHLAAMPAPWVIDTSGAGDWCTAGMLHHIFNENDNFKFENLDYNGLSRALRFGQVLSALNCMTLGARGLLKALPIKKITSTATFFKNALIKAELKQAAAPNAAWLASDFLRARIKENVMRSNPCIFEIDCCLAIP